MSSRGCRGPLFVQGPQSSQCRLWWRRPQNLLLPWKHSREQRDGIQNLFLFIYSLKSCWGLHPVKLPSPDNSSPPSSQSYTSPRNSLCNVIWRASSLTALWSDTVLLFPSLVSRHHSLLLNHSKSNKQNLAIISLPLYETKASRAQEKGSFKWKIQKLLKILYFFSKWHRLLFFVRRLQQSLVEFNGNSVAAQLPDFLVVFKREEKSKKKRLKMKLLLTFLPNKKSECVCCS